MKYVTTKGYGKRKFSVIFSCAKWPHSRVRLICTKTPTTRKLSNTRHVLTPIYQTSTNCKYQNWQTAKKRPLAASLALARQTTTESTKPKKYANFVSFVFHIQPANKNKNRKTFVSPSCTQRICLFYRL